jgi:Holliday junction resolvasome RuvABC endonuclease subunit
VNVFGVDPSTKRIGLTRPDGTSVSITATADSKDPIRRLHQLAEGVGRELRLWPGEGLLVIEKILLFGPGREALVRLGEVSGAVRTLAFERDLEVVEVPGSALKLAATGNGKADKDAMVAAAEAAGATVRNHDEADSWHLYNTGRRALDPALRHDLPSSVAALKWPPDRKAQP